MKKHKKRQWISIILTAVVLKGFAVATTMPSSGKDFLQTAMHILQKAFSKCALA